MASVALTEILMNNGNIGGMNLDGLLSSQLAAVRETGIEKQGSADRSPRYGEVWSNTYNIYRVGQSPEGLDINNATTVIFTIGNRCNLGEILEDLSLAPNDSLE